MRVNAFPKLLGVHLDRGLTFAKHIAEVTRSFASRNSILAHLAAKDWGWHPSSLRRVFQALQLSLFNHATPAWQPRRAACRRR